MARNDVTLVLKQAVVLGAGDKARTHAAGSTVKVPDDLGSQLISVGAATLVELPSSSGDTVTGD